MAIVGRRNNSGIRGTDMRNRIRIVEVDSRGMVDMIRGSTIKEDNTTEATKTAGEATDIRVAGTIGVEEVVNVGDTVVVDTTVGIMSGDEMGCARGK